MMQTSAAVHETLLATAFKGSVARQPRALSARNAIRALATEIDRTILPCRLCVGFGDGTSVFFLVRNRRLHGLGAADGHAMPPQLASGKLGADLALDLVHWINSLCGSTGLARIAREGLLPEDDLSSLGISPARLSLAAGLDLEPATRPDLQTRLARLIKADPSRVRAAFMMAGDDVSTIHGSPDIVEQLTDVTLDLLGHVTATDTPLAGLLETDGFLILPHPNVPDACIVMAGSLGLVSLIVVNLTSMPDAVRWWRSGKVTAP